jgi:hypothetical protein
MLTDTYIKEESKLHRMSKKELVSYAKSLGLTPYANVSKAQLKEQILRKKGLI